MLFARNIIIYVAFLLSPVTITRAEPISCPKHFDHSPMVSMHIFSGPPSERASLIGKDGGYWDFSNPGAFANGLFPQPSPHFA